MPILKLWTADRSAKKFISIPEIDINLLKEKAEEKFGIKVKSIVLESDGTCIEDNETLDMVQKEILLLLQEDELWLDQSIIQLADLSIPSPSSTVTRSSTPTTPSTSSAGEEDDTITQIEQNFFFKLPLELATALVQKKKFTYAQYTLFIHILADYIRKQNKYPGRKYLKNICDCIIKRYSSIADVDDDGKIIGVGYSTLLKKLEDRNNYLNRSSFNKDLQSKLKINYKRRKVAECPQWQPNNPEDEDNASIAEKKRRLVELHHLNVDNEEVETAMFKTFATQRLYLNQKIIPKMQDIINEWPYLFKEKYILQHFNHLTNCDLDEAIKNGIVKMKKAIYFLSNIPCDINDNNIILYKLLNHLSHYFKEKWEIILVEKEEHITKEEILETVDIITPHIVYIKEKCYYIIAEKVILYESKSFICAFKVLFALFYVLNLKYPAQASHILEFFQRYIVKLNPAEGSKATTKSVKICSILNKVLGLMKKLNDFVPSAVTDKIN